MNVAFVYRHKMTSEVLVVDIDRARELDAARPYWQHVSTVDPITLLQLIVRAKENMWCYEPKKIKENTWRLNYGYDSGD